jgi:thiol:disulfide interchange protein DsbA
MNRMLRRVASVLALSAVAVAGLSGEPAGQFREGTHYTVLNRPQPSQVAAGKVEVTEVFSYGCPGCNQFQSTIERLRAALPRNAEMVFVHASWNKAESWPVFQRAYATAQVLGIAEKSHAAMFNAIWGANAPLAVIDPKTGRLKPRQPTIEDVARFHAGRKDSTEEQFLAASRSFAVDTRVRLFETLVKGYAVPSTPCVIVAGRYRIEMDSVKTADELIALVRMLVQKAAA